MHQSHHRLCQNGSLEAEIFSYHIKSQRIVLGLITTKNGNLEDPEVIKARIADAAKIGSLEQLCLSPQCGFSSTQEGNTLPYEAQWEKLKLVREIAKEVWPDA